MATKKLLTFNTAAHFLFSIAAVFADKNHIDCSCIIRKQRYVPRVLGV